MLGADAVTVKLKALLAISSAVTTTGPELVPLGTGAWIVVPLHEEGAAGIPLNVTEPLPWVGPKFAPAIVTGVPIGPDEGVNDCTVVGGM